MKHNIVSVDKVYKLLHSSPLSFTIPSRSTRRFPLLWFDEDNNVNRPLRYAVNQKSPFEEKIPSSILHVDVISKNNTTGAINLINRFTSIGTGSSEKFDKHNSEVEQLSFDFYNNNVYESIDNAYFVKQFDNVPVSSYSIEISKDRVFLANNTEGYDTPVYAKLEAQAVEGSGASVSLKYFTQSFRIDFYDVLNDLIPGYNEYYFRNIAFVDGEYRVLTSVLDTSTNQSTKVGTLSIVPDATFLSAGTIVSTTGFFNMTPLIKGSEINVTNFSNTANNGLYFVVEKVDNNTIRVVKSDSTSPLVSESSAVNISITLLSSIYSETNSSLFLLPPNTLQYFTETYQLSGEDSLTNLNFQQQVTSLVQMS